MRCSRFLFVLAVAFNTLLVYPSTTSAACAWIVWTRVGPSEWHGFEILDNRAACVRMIEKSERAHRASSAQSVTRLSSTELRSWATDRAHAVADVHLMCLPETIAPPAMGAFR
jgi:hypothetical protein